MNAFRRFAPCVVLISGALALAGCATPAPNAGTASAGSDAEPTSPTAAAVVEGLATLVIDDGDGPELCLGLVQQSLPPQCGGPSLINWSWDAVPSETISGVQFSSVELWVVGALDRTAGTFTVHEARPATESDIASWVPRASDISSPCPEPEGGWQVLDPARTNDQTLSAAFERIDANEGIGGVWVDDTFNPARDVPRPGQDADPAEHLAWEASQSDPAELILNVGTTGDLKALEASIREVWGGKLCVSTTERSQAELDGIAAEVLESADPTSLLSVAADGVSGIVRAQFDFDDGSLQAAFDERYGEGLVEVTSALHLVKP